MLNRQQMISILSAMSDDKLIQAMSAAGIETGSPEGYELGDESADGIESWNARDVSVPPPNKPTFFDKAVIERPAQVMGQDRAAYMKGMSQDLGGLDPYSLYQLHSTAGG